MLLPKQRELGLLVLQSIHSRPHLAPQHRASGGRWHGGQIQRRALLPTPLSNRSETTAKPIAGDATPTAAER